MVTVLLSTSQQCLNPFTMLPVKGFFETGLFAHISNYVFWSALFREKNQLWGSSLVWKCSKFNVNFENAINNSENAFCFWDNCVRIGCLKLSLLRREYLSSAVNVLGNSYKPLYLTETNFFDSSTFKVITKYDKGAVAQITTVFEPVYHVACQRVLWNGTFWTYM